MPSNQQFPPLPCPHCSEESVTLTAKPTALFKPSECSLCGGLSYFQAKFGWWDFVAQLLLSLLLSGFVLRIVLMRWLHLSPVVSWVVLAGLMWGFIVLHRRHWDRRRGQMVKTTLEYCRKMKVIFISLIAGTMVLWAVAIFVSWMGWAEAWQTEPESDEWPTEERRPEEDTRSKT